MKTKDVCMEKRIELSPFHEVVSDFREGRMVIIVDDASRENEGDLTVATEKLTPEALSFMMHQARGLICISIPEEVATRLSLPLQTLANKSRFGTPFTVSVDHKSAGGDGISAKSRCHTMKALIDDDSREEDFSCPGNVFPLIANPAGVLGRQGQTEGSYDLARIAGLKASGVICEIMKEDGTMARGKDLQEFAARHNLKITSVEEIAKFRIREEVHVREVAAKKVKTGFGEFFARVFVDDAEAKEHLALIYGDISNEPAPMVRVHSECLTGDVLGSRRCDCGPQLHAAAEMIIKEGRGAILYLRQEGRGIGLLNKLRAYALQDQGADTVDANIRLGFAADLRDYVVAAQMLHKLGVKSVRLLTNNPEKIESLEDYGISVSERVPVIIPPDEYSKTYLETKRQRLGHLI